MDKIEKKIIVFTAMVMSVFVVALVYASTQGVSVPLCVVYDAKKAEPHVNQIADKTYEIFYVASMWRFEPEEVELPVGAEVDVYLASKDVVHGFNIQQKALNMMAVPGGLLKQTVKFDKKGTYQIVCHEYCGAGHQNMMAKVIVK